MGALWFLLEPDLFSGLLLRSWLSILPSKLNESRHSICLNLKIIDCYSQYIGKELVDADDEERLDEFVCMIPELFLQQFH